MIKNLKFSSLIVKFKIIKMMKLTNNKNFINNLNQKFNHIYKTTIIKIFQQIFLNIRNIVLKIMKKNLRKKRKFS